jgi:adenine-specific DNA-methyltransferase
MAKKFKSLTSDWKQMIVSYRHDAKRVNNPDVGMVNPETDPDQPKTAWAYDPHIDPALQFDVQRAHIERIIDDALESGDESTMREALETLRRMQAPYLNWTGKAERTSFEVDTVSLHVHERIDPASILSALQKKVKGTKDTSFSDGVQQTHCGRFIACDEFPAAKREHGGSGADDLHRSAVWH